MKRVILLLFGVISSVFVCGEEYILGGECSNCLPKAHLKVYEQRSCTPIISPECDCPLAYDCPPEVTVPPLPEAEVLKLKTLGENACIFEDKVYGIGENLQVPCLDKSVCESSETVRNVSGYMIQGDAYGDRGSGTHECGRALPKGCYRTYPANKCTTCPTGKICKGHEKADFRCKVGEEYYGYGQQIGRMKHHMCTVCHCDEKFDLNNLEGSTCWQIRCRLRLPKHLRGKNGNTIDQDVLMQHCNPIYRKHSCCAMDFICAENFDPDAGIFGERPTNQTETCWLRGRKYEVGEKMNFNTEDTYRKYEDDGGECTCRVPPLMTCYWTKDY